VGYGSYSYAAHQAITSAREAAPTQSVFAQRECHPLMRPHGIEVRECRDSPEHPSTLPIVLALDVTGSMGEIPAQLAKRELPHLMKALLDHGVRDPQVLFLAVGDAFHDRAPLQVGQFEATAELMDQWLTWSWLEGGGGPHGNESYELALWFVARHVETDALRMRNKRGYLFMTGDEKPYPALSRDAVRSVLGDEIDDDVLLRDLVEDVRRGIEPFFLIPDLERRAAIESTWRDLLGDRVIAMESPHDTTNVIGAIVAMNEGALPDLEAVGRMLEGRGTDRERIGAVIRALRPWAASLARDGSAAPTLDTFAGIPDLTDDDGGYTRP
jgi:hypothetical protein